MKKKHCQLFEKNFYCNCIQIKNLNNKYWKMSKSKYLEFLISQTNIIKQTHVIQ